MSCSTVFYLASVVLSLYAAYLFTFKTYSTDYDGKPIKRMVCPNIIYLLVWMLTFVPIANVIISLVFAIMALMAMVNRDVYVDSWLFRKPKQEQPNKKE